MADGTAGRGRLPRGAAKSWISLSKLDRYRNCRRSAWYHDVIKARTAVVSSNLVYGKVVHEATERFKANGEDPVEVFRVRWAEETAATAIQYTQTMDQEDLRATGELVLQRYKIWWNESGLSLAYGPDGRPLVELSLGADLGDGIQLWGVIDNLVFDADGRLLILDDKTPATACSERFPLVADQLTDYQVLVEANEPTLKVGPVDAMGYVELLKRKVPITSRGEGPVVVMSTLAPARTPDQLKAWIEKVRGEIQDMRDGRYPRDPGPAYRTACDGCDFAMHCIHGVEEGLVVPDDKWELLRNGPA